MRSARSVRKLETPGKLMVQFQSKSKGLTIMRAVGVSSSMSLSLKAGDRYPSPNIGREKEFFLPQAFILFNPSVNWMSSTTLERAISSRNTLTEMSRIMFNQMSEHVLAQLS